MSLIEHFPNLERTGYELTSPQTRTYNCIAWAAKDDTKWWWPEGVGSHWPDGVPREKTTKAFIQAFETIGYSLCEDHSLEYGIEKIAIYERLGMVKHASRQLSDGKWTSKLGRNIDITHTFDGLDGGIYGYPVKVMMRRHNSSG